MGRIVWFAPPLVAAGVGTAAAPFLAVAGVAVVGIAIGAYFFGKKRKTRRW